MEKIECFGWIRKIISTCSSEFHFIAVDKIISLFYEKYLDGQLRTDLSKMRDRKWDEIYSKISI
jgi:hypothetical protein